VRPEDHDWHHVQELATRLQRESGSDLTDVERELVRRVARDVAISDSDAEKALQRPSGDMELAVEVSRRIREGSRRLSQALVRSARLSAAGDTAAARKVLQDLLDVEVVPLYRRHAQSELDELV
jgi:DUSAM domain-containing protein